MWAIEYVIAHDMFSACLAMTERGRHIIYYYKDKGFKEGENTLYDLRNLIPISINLRIKNTVYNTNKDIIKKSNNKNKTKNKY